jgi:hypothetical protein
MDSRVPGVPKDGALEAREAKFIETGPAGAERTGLLKRYFRGKRARGVSFGIALVSSPVRLSLTTSDQTTRLLIPACSGRKATEKACRNEYELGVPQ